MPTVEEWELRHCLASAYSQDFSRSKSLAGLPKGTNILRNRRTDDHTESVNLFLLQGQEEAIVNAHVFKDFYELAIQVRWQWSVR
jgi:hypothetical protein